MISVYLLPNFMGLDGLDEHDGHCGHDGLIGLNGHCGLNKFIAVRLN